MTGRRLTDEERKSIRDLHASGVSTMGIAARMGVVYTTVRYILDPEGERKRRAYLVGARRSARELVAAISTLPPGPVYPPVRRKLLADPQTKMAAVRDFAVGAIDRSELMKRITVYA